VGVKEQLEGGRAGGDLVAHADRTTGAPET